jgi:hypothetical protein
VLPKQCGICHSIVQSEEDIQRHERECNNGLDGDLASTHGSISEWQQFLLKQKQLSSATKEESWMRMYRVLFPNDSSIPSPCESIFIVLPPLLRS